MSDAFDLVYSEGFARESAGVSEPWSVLELSDALPVVMAQRPTFSLVFIDNQDLVLELAKQLCDPLRADLVHLSRTAKGLRLAMQTPVAELRMWREAAKAMVVVWGKSLQWLRESTVLALGEVGNIGRRPTTARPVTLAHWRALGMLIGCGALPRLRGLQICRNENGDEGVNSLAAGIRRGPPSIEFLLLIHTQLAPQGASALATVLTKQALPSLQHLDLGGNLQLGDAGLAALASGLRQLPALKTLGLQRTNITDQGVASLLAEPLTGGVLNSLQKMYLRANQIADDGCATIASAVRSGALPALV